ncbi:hypothetical protein AeNC1_017093 [Aphanomyces euteiches]|nr:hypothetical protein AeNC1_017093 [Aphanomyces euteiches]
MQAELFGAAAYGNLEAVQALLRQGVDVNWVNEKEYDMTALHVAAVQGHPSVVKELVANGANIEARNKNGNTPLIDAALKGHLEVVQALLDLGADVNARNEWDDRAHMCASWEGHLDVLKLLLAHGADVNAMNTVRRCSLMHRLAFVVLMG